MRCTSTIKFREMKIVIFLYYMKFHYEFIASSSYHLYLSSFFLPHNKIKNNLNIRKPCLRKTSIPSTTRTKDRPRSVHVARLSPHSFSRGIKSITPFLDRTKHSRPQGDRRHRSGGHFCRSFPEFSALSTIPYSPLSLGASMMGLVVCAPLS